VLNYTISRGVVSQLTLDLPRDLEVRSVEAEVAEKPGGVAPRFRDWTLTDLDSHRRLQLMFLGPVSGNVRVILELLPRQPFGARVVLPFPIPRNAQPSREGLLAYRVEGLEAAFGDGRGIKGIDAAKLAEIFSHEFAQPWRATRREDLDLPTNAFWSTPGVVPYLPLNLRKPALRLRSEQEVSWNVRSQLAEFRASAKLSDAEGLAALLEWDVPPAVVLDSVTGADVRSWSRNGSRLQIWLNRPLRETSIQWTGWLTRRAEEAARFELPCFRCLSARAHESKVVLSASDALALVPDQLQNLTPLSDQRIPRAEIAYRCEQPTYSATFQVRPARASADARILTFAEVRDRRLTFVATFDCRLRQSELRHLTIQLRNWDTGEVQLQAPQVAERREQRRGPAGRSWALDLKPGVTDLYRLTLSGSLPLGATPELLMPDVRVEAPSLAPARVSRWLALAGPDLLADATSGLAVVSDLGQELQPWNGGEPDRLRRAGGTAWRVRTNDWQLRLRARDLSALMPFVQVFLTERTAAVVDGKSWIHQATFWLYHEAGADLRVIMPPASSPVLSVMIDNAEVTPLQPQNDRLWLPLPGRAGACTVQLTWSYEPSKESLDWPNLDPPQLEGISAGPVLWTVHIPAGYQLSPGSARSTLLASAAGQELRRAAAQLQLLTFLADRSQLNTDSAFSAQVQSARARFERSRRHAEHQLALPAKSSGDAGPNGQSLGDWLQQLRTQYTQIVRTYELDKAVTDEKEPRAASDPSRRAEPRSLVLALREQGTPHFWQAQPGTPAPRLLLIPEPAKQYQLAWIWSGLMVLLLAASWVLARTPWAKTWPEQIALLGFVGLLAFGPEWGIYFLCLPLFWLLVRLGTLVRWLLTFRARREPVEAAPIS
jgi:hypothetical protein